MRKKIYTLLTIAAVFCSVMPVSGISAAVTDKDYYARNFMVTDNNVFWAGCAQISWFNPAEKPEKVELYALSSLQSDGNYVLVGDNFDTTANASVVTSLPTVKWNVYPRNSWYTFKLVTTFADGRVSEQTADHYVLSDTEFNSNVWQIKTDVSDDFRISAQRGGWCYTGSTGNGYDLFPIKSELVYDDGNPALKVWSNAHILNDTDETRDGKTNNSGNYYGELLLTKSVEKGEEYEVSFCYKAKGIEHVTMHLNSKEISENIGDTNGEWKNYSKTVTAKDGIMLNFEFRVGNEEFVIDDVVVKKQGEDENILSDGDFSKLAMTAPGDVSNAAKVADKDKVTLTWEDSSGADGVNVYKVENGVEIKKAYVKQSAQKVTVDGTIKDEYILKAVNKNGVEAEGAVCSLPSYKAYELAAKDVMASPTGKSGEILVAWRNSDCPAISEVILKDSDGNVLDDSTSGNLSTEAGAFCTYTMSGLDNYEFKNFVLETVTEQGSLEQPISGTAVLITDSGYTYSYPLTDKMDVNLMAQDTGKALVQARAGVVKDAGSNVLKIINNIIKSTSNVYLEIRVPTENIELKESTQYKLELRYKGSGYAWQKIYIHDQGRDLGGVDLFTSKKTVNDWTNFSKTFKTAAGAQTQGIRIMMEQPTDGPLWIDDIKLTEVSTGDVVFSEDFETLAGTCVTDFENLKAEAKDGKVKLSWTAPEIDGDLAKVVRIYAESNGKKYLAAKVSPFDSSIELSGLTNGEEYTFIFDSVDMHGFVSEATEIKATPKADNYKVSEVKLLDKNGNEVNSVSAGDYKFTAKIKNNGMGNDFTAQVIVCLYDGDTLYEAKSSDIIQIAETDWKKNPTELVTKTLTVPNTQGKNFTIKAYIWDSIKGMTKLADTSEYK